MTDGAGPAAARPTSGSLDETGRDLPLERSPFGLARATGEPVPARSWAWAAADGADDPLGPDGRAPPDAPGGSHLVVLTCSDVTAERDAVLALVTAERRLRLTAEHAPIGIALVGTDGALLDVNEALCRLLGYSREELTARTFHDITHPDHLAGGRRARSSPCWPARPRPTGWRRST